MNFWVSGPDALEQPQVEAFVHDGPLFAYLARSPDQSGGGLKKWDANGDYFKIAERGPDMPRWFDNVYKAKRDMYEVSHSPSQIKVGGEIV